MNMESLTDIKYFLNRWEELVSCAPDKTAAVDGATDIRISRCELDVSSAKVYRYLINHGIGKEDFVMICLPRGTDILTCILGVWKAGAAFTVVEDDYAPDRIEYIRNDVGCKLFIDRNLFTELMNEEPLMGFAETSPHDACFAIYTSGTTGFPKGVLHEYGNILIDSKSGTGSKRVNENSRYALISPMNFVASVKVFLVMLKTGCTIYVIPYDIAKNPLLLKDYYIKNEITVSFLSPSIIRVLGRDLGPYLKYVFTGSEPAGGISLDNAELINTYSMSEALFSLSTYLIKESSDSVPVGKSNSELIKINLLDENGIQVPPGQIGEVTFENPFMRGYINLPSETRKVLKDGIFYTGDLGRMLPDGNLVLLGRKNEMIKINGNRIEPAEIERAFREITSISNCVAKGFEDPAHSFICLYYTDNTVDNNALNDTPVINMGEESLRAKLRDILPYYMVPSYFVRLDNIPLLPNGKVDKKSLPKPDDLNCKIEYLAPTNDTERIVCEAFAQILGISPVGINHDFYKFGGDSLKTMALLAKLNCPHLTADDIFRECTPGRIAHIISSGGNRINSLEEAEYAARKGKYNFTATQRYLYSLEYDRDDCICWDLPLAFRIVDPTNCEKICIAMNKAMKNSPVFSTVATREEDGSLMLHIDPASFTPVKVYDVSESELTGIRNDYVWIDRNIFNKPLYRIEIYRTPSEAFLFINVDHYIIDGSAYQMLFSNLIDAYYGNELPLDTFYTYLKNENEKYSTAQYASAKNYLQDNYGGVNWSKSLAPDKDIPSDKVPINTVILPGITSSVLEDFEVRSGLTRNGLITLALLLARAKVDGLNKQIINWIFHDRVDAVREKALGCVFKNLPIGIDFSKYKTLSELFDALKLQSINNIRNASCDWMMDADVCSSAESSMVVYETADIMQSQRLAHIGLVPDMLENPRVVNPVQYAAQIMELPDTFSINYFYHAKRYDEEHALKYQAVVSDIFFNILNCKDYKNTSVKELLK